MGRKNKRLEEELGRVRATLSDLQGKHEAAKSSLAEERDKVVSAQMLIAKREEEAKSRKLSLTPADAAAIAELTDQRDRLKTHAAELEEVITTFSS